MNHSLGEAISRAILAHANQKGEGDPLWQVIEDAIRKEFDVRRRPEWVPNLQERTW